MAYLYRHIRLDKNEPFYIGIGSNNDGYKRAYCKDKRNVHWRNIVQKNEYRVDIIIDDLTLEEAREKEIWFISLYGRKNINNGLLTNLNNGGEGNFGWKPTEEQNKKNSEAHKGIVTWNKGIPHTEDYKKNLSEIMKVSAYWKDKELPFEVREKISKNLYGRYRGEDSPHYGKTRPQELIDRIAEINKGNKYMLGKKHSVESKSKMSESHKGNKNWLGKEHSEETKNKISKANKGKTSPNKGKITPIEVRLKLSMAHKGKVLSQEHRDKISKANKGKKQKKRVYKIKLINQ
jgi:hypothetical protein